jgi:Tfp pilus assembly PilM family ATPase/Tfp pilus assembly protein PilN
MPVTLNISSRDIRVVASSGSTITKWETVPLLAGMVKNGQILQPSAVAEVINATFEKLHLPRKQVIISLSGMSFTYRVLTLPSLKSSLLREAIQRATQREINVPLDELYIDWQIITDNAKEIKVFVLAVSRSIIDTLVQTLSQAKVKLSAIDIKSLALARAINDANALIVDFEPDWFDIIIISEGIPATLHTTACKSEIASVEDKVQQLVDELNRTLDFYNITHKKNPILPETPVILTGALAADPAARELLLQKIGHPVQAIVPQVKAPANFPASPYAVNLGLAWKPARHGTYAQKRSSNYVDVNLDPLVGKKRETAPTISLRKLLMPAVILIVCLLLIPGYMLKNSATAETNHLQTELTRVSRFLFIQRLALDDANITTSTISNLTAEIKNIQHEQDLLSGRGPLSAILNLITNTLPQGAEYTAITVKTAQVRIDGRAGSRSDVINYARNLEKQGHFTGVRLALIEEIPPESNAILTVPPVIFSIVIER